MNFTNLVFDKLDSIFHEYKFEALEQHQNYVKLQSNKVVLTFSFDKKENICALYAGRKNEEQYNIDGNIIELCFSELKSQLIIPERTMNEFVYNVAVLFNSKGKSILEGEIKVFKKISNYYNELSKKYSVELDDKQNIKYAMNSWDEKDYFKFIYHLSKVSDNKLTPSLLRKLAIAKNKIK
jgi:hypothetical protein